jgi:hypothetical protein
VKMGPTRCPETSVNNYHTTPCNYPKHHRLRLLFLWREVSITSPFPLSFCMLKSVYQQSLQSSHYTQFHLTVPISHNHLHHSKTLLQRTKTRHYINRTHTMHDKQHTYIYKIRVSTSARISLEILVMGN